MPRKAEPVGRRRTGCPCRRSSTAAARRSARRCADPGGRRRTAEHAGERAALVVEGKLLRDRDAVVEAGGFCRLHAEWRPAEIDAVAFRSDWASSLVTGRELDLERQAGRPARRARLWRSRARPIRSGRRGPAARSAIAACRLARGKGELRRRRIARAARLLVLDLEQRPGDVAHDGEPDQSADGVEDQIVDRVCAHVRLSRCPTGPALGSPRLYARGR